MANYFLVFGRVVLLVFLTLLFSHMPLFPEEAGLAAEPGLEINAKGAKLLFDREYYQALLSGIDQAREEIVLVAFLFKTSDSRRNKPAAVMRRLIEASKRGVRVEVLLENSGYDDALNRENKKAATLLQRNNISVRFDSVQRTTHAKLVVIDQRYILLGSHNLTHSALSTNHEVSTLIDNPVMALQLLNYIKNL